MLHVAQLSDKRPATTVHSLLESSTSHAEEVAEDVAAADNDLKIPGDDLQAPALPWSLAVTTVLATCL